MCCDWPYLLDEAALPGSGSSVDKKKAKLADRNRTNNTVVKACGGYLQMAAAICCGCSECAVTFLHLRPVTHTTSSYVPALRRRWPRRRHSSISIVRGCVVTESQICINTIFCRLVTLWLSLARMTQAVLPWQRPMGEEVPAL